MDNPDRHLREFIRNHFYMRRRGYPHPTPEEVDRDARKLIEFMRARGWQFELIKSKDR